MCTAGILWWRKRLESWRISLENAPFSRHLFANALVSTQLLLTKRYRVFVVSSLAKLDQVSLFDIALVPFLQIGKPIISVRLNGHTMEKHVKAVDRPLEVSLTALVRNRQVMCGASQTLCRLHIYPMLLFSSFLCRCHSFASRSLHVLLTWSVTFTKRLGCVDWFDHFL